MFPGDFSFPGAAFHPAWQTIGKHWGVKSDVARRMPDTFSDSSGNFVGQVGYLANVVVSSPVSDAQIAIIQQNAAGDTPLVENAMVATDQPYHDNVPYADISDFFYICNGALCVP